MKNQYSDIVRNVVQNIRTAFPETATSKAATQLSIKEAMDSLGEFVPDVQDSTMLNEVLLHLRASDIACKSAWALYKDYSINQSTIT